MLLMSDQRHQLWIKNTKKLNLKVSQDHFFLSSWFARWLVFTYSAYVADCTFCWVSSAAFGFYLPLHTCSGVASSTFPSDYRAQSCTRLHHGPKKKHAYILISHVARRPVSATVKRAGAVNWLWIDVWEWRVVGNLSSFPPLSRSSKHKDSAVHQHLGIYCTSYRNVKSSLYLVTE